ncbi:proteasome subunit alpha type-5-like [Schistocerca gregaria]|uniref:proteasome subunit alpha type-5-like n=1 Tax=Schistocerca gregaria TaxID=7010 RepID=UPI00211EF1E0|nr:proteasome subunit alpha type-5-like [Schistocerca gregaria]
MYLVRNEYDRGVNTFSPEGRLWQIEYAMEAIQLGSTAVGIQTQDGIVLAAERRMTSRLTEPWSVQKILEIDSHIACALSGLVPDARTLIDHARVDAQNYSFNYSEPIPVESVIQSICDLALRFGENNEDEDVMSRPFGVALLVGGVDEKGPFLYHTDPAGNYTQYLAKAIGNGSDTAQTQLEQHYHRTMSLEEAKTLALTILKQVVEEKLTAVNIEVAVVPLGTKKMEYLQAEEIEKIVANTSNSDLAKSK